MPAKAVMPRENRRPGTDFRQMNGALLAENTKSMQIFSLYRIFFNFKLYFS